MVSGFAADKIVSGLAIQVSAQTPFASIKESSSILTFSAFTAKVTANKSEKGSNSLRISILNLNISAAKVGIKNEKLRFPFSPKMFFYSYLSNNNLCFVIILAEFSGCTAFFAFEHTVEVAQVVISTEIANIGDALVCIHKHS